MKATELMIGDWVLCGGEHYQIAEIGGMVCLDADKELFAFLFEVEPIPLTQEILEKNGFKNTSVVTIGTRKMRWVSDDTRTEITIWMDDVLPMEIVKNVYYEDEVAYTLPSPGTVSQLQHALRLCGINLEIKI